MSTRVKFDTRRHSRHPSNDHHHRTDPTRVSFSDQSSYSSYSPHEEAYHLLQTRHDEAARDRDRWQSKAQDLEKQLDEIRKQLRGNDANHRALENRNDNLEDDNKRLTDDVKHLTKEKKQLADELATLRDELETLRAVKTPAIPGTISPPESTTSESKSHRSSNKRDKERGRESKSVSRSQTREARDASRARERARESRTTSRTASRVRESVRSRDESVVREAHDQREAREAREALDADAAATAGKEKAKLAERFQRDNDSDTKSTSTKSSRSSQHRTSVALTKPSTLQTPYVEPFGPITTTLHTKPALSPALSPTHHYSYSHAPISRPFGPQFPAAPTHDIIHPSVHVDVGAVNTGAYFPHPLPIKEKSSRSRR